MKIAVTGANGQLGTDVCDVLGEKGHEVVSLTHDVFDISNEQVVRERLGEIKPQVLINTAAFHHVDQCEQDPAKAFLVNVIAPGFLAQQCRLHETYFIHISTDYVFGGEKKAPYTEEDMPNPLNNYGISKLAGEFIIHNTWERSLVVRTSGLYGLNPCRAKGGKNFVELMLSLASSGKPLRVVDSEFVSPTFTLHLARQLEVLAQSDVTGICHATAQGWCSWFEFAAEIFRKEGIQADLSVAEQGAFASKVKRPSYSVLDNRKLKTEGIDQMVNWKQALHEYLEKRKELNSNVPKI